MFLSIITTLSPVRMNSAAALIPLMPPPIMTTSHLIDLSRGGQYLNCFISSVVNHQF
jgi:hypothetical protein